MWEGFRKLEQRGVNLDSLREYDVLLLPEDIEEDDGTSELIQTVDSIDLYKAFKSQSANVKDFEDLMGEKIPLYDRRGDMVWLGTIVISDLALNFVINILSDRVISLFRNRTIKCKVRIPNAHGVVKIDYEGDSSSFIKIINALKNSE